MAKYETVYADLRERLASGEFKPGDDFPSIANVMRKHDVSMGTAERALRKLRNEGLILIRQGHQNQVVALPPKDELDVLAELQTIRTALNRVIDHLSGSGDRTT